MEVSGEVGRASLRPWSQFHPGELPKPEVMMPHGEVMDRQRERGRGGEVRGEREVGRDRGRERGTDGPRHG